MSIYYNDGWNDAVEFVAKHFEEDKWLSIPARIRAMKKELNSTISNELDKAIADEIKDKPKDIMG